MLNKIIAALVILAILGAFVWHGRGKEITVEAPSPAVLAHAECRLSADTAQAKTPIMNKFEYDEFMADCMVDKGWIRKK